MKEKNRLLYAALLSLFIHIFPWALLNLLSQRTPLLKKYSQNPPPLKVERITQNQLQKYRRVGIKGGKKDFMLALANRNRGLSPQRKQKKQKKQNQELSLSSLRIKSSSPPSSSPNSSKREEEKGKEKKKEKGPGFSKSELTTKLLKEELYKAEQGLPLTALRSPVAMNNFRHQRKIQRNLLQELGTNSTRAETLKHADFNLHFEPPEGISEDELNSVEKIFYSFQKRTFINYVNSFLSNYQKSLNKHPTIKKSLAAEKHLLTGRITFDKEGNIVRIKILKSSPSDDIHQLFEKTLLNMSALPNPPKAMVKNKEEFNIYYQLKIN